ncbi:MAG: zinc-ribbon domain-containing protein [Eubacteriales bacterium]|nr:zinc-ribbon domain-containing protein [Eubacteriales bacterium]
MWCTNCGSQLPDNSVFCSYCGHRQGSPEQADQAISQAGSEDKIETADINEELGQTEEQVEEVANAPEASDVPEIPEAPEVPEVPETPRVPETAAVPEAIATPEVPDLPETPETSAPPETPEVPEVPEVVSPTAVVAGSVEAAAKAPEVPEVPEEPKPIFCPQCGKQARPGTVFCTNCGKNLKQKTAEPSAAAGAYPPPAGPVPPAPTRPSAAPTAYGQPNLGQQPAPSPYGQPPYGQPAAPTQYGQPVYGQPGYNAPPAAQPAKAKKSKKGLAVFLIILVVIIAAGAVTWVFAGRDVMRMIRGPKKSYIAVETKQLREYTADLVEMMIRGGSDDTTGGRTFDIALDVNGSMLGLDPSLETTIENIQLKNTYMFDQSGSNKMYNKLDFMVGQEEVLTVEALKDDDQMMLGVPQIIGSYLMGTEQQIEDVMGPESGIDFSALSTVGQLAGLGIDMERKDLEKSLNELTDITVKYIDEAEFEKNVELNVGSVDAVYDTYTVETSGENLRKMMKEILELLRDDPVFYDLFYQLSGINSTEDEMAEFPSQEEWQEELDVMLSDLEDSDEELEEVAIIQTVYLDKKDIIHARYITLIDEMGSTMVDFTFYDEVENDGFYASGFEVIDEYGSMTSVIAEYEKDGEKKTGVLVVNSEGSDMMTVDFQDFESVDVGDETWYTGSASINTSPQAVGEAVPVIDWSGSYEDDRYEIIMGADEFGSITIGYQIIPAKDADIPSLTDVPVVSVTDEAALQGLMTEDVMVNMQNVMTSMGISEEMISGLFYGGYEEY